MKRIVLTCLSVLLIPVAWQLLSWQMAQPQLIPSFPDLMQALLRVVSSPGFLVSIGTTLLRACVGLLLSLAAASITAFLLNRSETIRLLFMPWLSLLRSVPVISFILLALIFLNPEMIPLLIAFLTMYPLLTENLLKGLMNRRDSWKMLARQFHLNAWNRLFQINYPQLKPYLFSGLASAVGFGWRAIIMGEVLSQCVDGIGKRMKEAQVFIDVPELIAWTLVAIVLSWLTDKLISRLSDWQPSVRYRHSAVALPAVSLQPHDISLAAGRSFFALVPQDAILFNMSIMDNIRMGRLDATEAEIIKAAKMANAHQFIIEFTDGYDTVVGEKGMSVSGGQRQRIAIARAILKNAPIMLMDEATSALDNESERAVNETLQNLKGRMTIIMIAHRTSTIQMADRVIGL